MIEEGMVASACSVGYGGIAEALFKMGLGNRKMCIRDRC